MSAVMFELHDLAQAHANLVKVGMAAERERLLPILEAIFRAYDRAAAMPQAMIPSILTAAIQSARMNIEPGEAEL